MSKKAHSFILFRDRKRPFTVKQSRKKNNVSEKRITQEEKDPPKDCIKTRQLPLPCFLVVNSSLLPCKFAILFFIFTINFPFFPSPWAEKVIARNSYNYEP